jgi:RNA-directed DNA polymerase
MIKKFDCKYDYIISPQNLLASWNVFLKGKKMKKDVQVFRYTLADNIISLYNDLENKTYKHDSYQYFPIQDPKPRDIHKATVRDRLVHHALYRSLYNYFDKKFIYDSCSCRLNKGTHMAMSRFKDFCNKVSKNNTRQCWILKCDIKKFFASIDHQILIEILNKYIDDQDIISLIKVIVKSFYSTKVGKGLPLGNLTSQLLVNIYMNEFDQFVKHKIMSKYYVRYADDFVFLDNDKKRLINIIPKINSFFLEKLKLNIHPNKIYIKTLSSGIDFLGWVHFSYHQTLRTSTKHRMLKKLEKDFRKEVLYSYLGLLGHGDGYKLKQKILNYI